VGTYIFWLTVTLVLNLVLEHVAVVRVPERFASKQHTGTLVLIYSDHSKGFGFMCGYAGPPTGGSMGLKD